MTLSQVRLWEGQTNAKEKQNRDVRIYGTYYPNKRWRRTVRSLGFVKGRMRSMKILRLKYPYNLLVNDFARSKSSLVDCLRWLVTRWCSGRKRESVASDQTLFSAEAVQMIFIHVKERWDTGKLTIDFWLSQRHFKRKRLNLFLNVWSRWLKMHDFISDA